MVVEENDYEKDVKFRNHFVFNWIVHKIAKIAGKYENHMEKLKSVTDNFKIEPKGCWKGAKGRHNLTKGRQKGAEGSQKRAKREPQGTKREPKGAKGEPKGAKGEPKDDKNGSNIDARKKILKKGGPASIFWLILEPFWWAKTFKSIEKQTLFLIFVIFGKVLKKKFLELILAPIGRFGDPFWKSAAPKTPLFARLLSQGTCRYTYPMR